MFALGLVDGDVECGILYAPSNRLLVQPGGECDRDDGVFDIPEYERSEFRASSYGIPGGWSWLF